MSEETRRDLERFGFGPTLLKAALKEFPQKMWLYQPNENRWSIHAIIIHLADSEASSYVRCRRAIAEPGSPVLGLDSRRWSESLRYVNQSSHDALDTIVRLRKATYKLLSAIPDRFWDNEVAHRLGPLPLKRWLNIQENHIPHHISQMRENYQKWLSLPPGNIIIPASEVDGLSPKDLFNDIDSNLRKDPGCKTELDALEQMSWLIFLKYLDTVERDKTDNAALHSRRHSFRFDNPHRWENWVGPSENDDKTQTTVAKTGNELLEFVREDLFPYLHSFSRKRKSARTLEYKIGAIFGCIKNTISSGDNLREIIKYVDQLQLGWQNDLIELSRLYETKIKSAFSAPSRLHQHYTPRPIIRAVVRVVQPVLGERVYDGACGSAGFLCESFEYLKTTKKLDVRGFKTLGVNTLFGREKNPLIYTIAVVNMILHGIEAPNIIRDDTLAEDHIVTQETTMYDVTLSNPGFGKERKRPQQSFGGSGCDTGLLFLQHFMKVLEAGGRGAIVMKGSFASSADADSIRVRKLLFDSCNVHTVLVCPKGTFAASAVKAVVLFFNKGFKTKNIWFYELNPHRNLRKDAPLCDADLTDFIRLQKYFGASPKSWSVDANILDPTTLEFPIRNPNSGRPAPRGRTAGTIQEGILSDLEKSNEHE